MGQSAEIAIASGSSLEINKGYAIPPFSEWILMPFSVIGGCSDCRDSQGSQLAGSLGPF